MKIGAFPVSRSQADSNELNRALIWMEMILNSEVGKRPMSGFWRIYEVPLEAGIGDYILSDYDNDAGTQHVFSAYLVDTVENLTPLTILFEDEGMAEDLKATSRPNRIVVTRDLSPAIKCFPVPTIDDYNAGRKIRIRVQTFHHKIASSGTTDVDLLIRPSWYLWMTKKLAYELGGGPIRKLEDSERKVLAAEIQELEGALISYDGRYNKGKPPVTEPMAGSV